VPRCTLYFRIYPEDRGSPAALAPLDPLSPTECYRRSESLVPQQALVLTNGEPARRCSRELAARLWEGVQKKTRPEPFVAAAFERILSRPPRPAELDACARLLRTQAAVVVTPGRATPAEAARRARDGLVRSLFNHYEFVTLR
jgi:hypothetical protein